MPKSTENVEMTPAQGRAARALLDWTQPHLAEAADLGLSTIVDFERGRRAVSESALVAIRAALEAAGVEFTNGREPGVKLKAKPQSIAGEDLNSSNDE
jgi:transcriptional regulator with XRE-family HTH domain